MPSTVQLIDHIWSLVLPPPATRKPHDIHSLLLLIIPTLLLILAAHLRLRHPGLPLLFRIPFAVGAVWVTIRLTCSHYAPFYTYRASGHAISMIPADFVAGVAAAVWSLLIVELTLVGEEGDYDVRGADEYRRWLADKTVAPSELHAIASRSSYTLERPLYFPGTSLPLELDILASIRGLGYGRGMEQEGVRFEAGYPAYIQSQLLAKRSVAEARALKWKAIGKAFRVTLQCYLAVDAIECFYHHPAIFSAVRHYAPVSISDAANGALGAYGPWFMTVLLCVYLICAMQAVSTSTYLVALLGFTNLSDVPITISRYEPLMFARPHLSTSLRDLWGIHWHAFFRRIFVVFGFGPGRRAALRVGLPHSIAKACGILSAFFVSGMMHEMCLEAVLPHYQQWDPAGTRAGAIRTADRGFGAHNFVSTRFFLAQGCGLIVEDVWATMMEPWLARLLIRQTTVTGKSGKGKPYLVTGGVRGVLGWTWCMSMMVYFGYSLINVWLEHGVGATTFSFQLTRPIVYRVVDHFT